MQIITLLLVGYLAGPALAKADLKTSGGDCPSFLTQQGRNILFMIVDAAQTLASSLPEKAKPTAFKTLERGVGRFIGDWHGLYNERVIERQQDELATYHPMSVKQQRDLFWQATRALKKHRPDLVGDETAGWLLVDRYPLLLFVGTEEMPREIPPDVLLILHNSDPVGWLRNTGNNHYSEWIPVSSGH